MKTLSIKIELSVNLGIKEDNMKRFTLLLLILTCFLTLNSVNEIKYGKLKVRVKSDTESISKAKVMLYENNKPTKIKGTTNAEGVCTFKKVPVGQYDVRVSKKGYIDISENNYVIIDKETDFSIEIYEASKLGSISFNVADTNNNPGAYAIVVFYKDGVNTHMGMQANENGICNFINIPVGVYDVKVTKLGHAPVTIEKLSINAGENNPQNITIVKATNVVSAPEVSAEKSDLEIEEIDCIQSTALDNYDFTNNYGNPISGSVRVRGGRTGEVVYSVDGISAPEPVDCGTPPNVRKRQQISPMDMPRFTRPAIDPIPQAVEFEKISSNEFITPEEEAYSTFSIDVDTGSYTAIRKMINDNYLPRKDMIRIEEFINYFDYDYVVPKGSEPFSINTEVGRCPWEDEHYLVHIGLKGKELDLNDTPPSNLVFLVDVSGSMRQPNKLPLVKQSLKLLTKQLRSEDTVSIAVYASSEGVALEPTKGSEKQTILDAIDNLQAGGGTAGQRGIRLAYKIAKENLLKNGNNRIILCSDGDFNVGVSNTEDLIDMVKKETENNIFLTILGFGMDNLKDNRLESIANKCNGTYGYIDGIMEAKKIFVTQLTGSLFTIAKDVKIQVEFNPTHVEAYRLIGYVNRKLAAEDFNNDKKDAGELGAGHTVTALYEIVPADSKSNYRKVDPSRYQSKPKPEPRKVSDSHIDELLFVKLRYKEPKGTKSKLIERAVPDVVQALKRTSDNFRFSAAVTAYGFMLQDNEFKGTTDWELVKNLAKKSLGEDKYGYRAEFMQLIEKAELLQNN